MKSILTVLSVVSLVGCASTPEPRVVRATELASLGSVEPGQPLVVLFERGDQIPLSVVIGGPLVKSPEGAAPIPLEVQRRFYLRLDESGMKTSLDGKTFGDAVEPGQFSVGVGATKEGANARIEVKTPTLREP